MIILIKQKFINDDSIADKVTSEHHSLKPGLIVWRNVKHAFEKIKFW